METSRERLAMPAGVRLRPMASWNRYFGTPAASDTGWQTRLREFDALGRPATMRWLLDLDIVIEPGDQISQVVFTSGLYEPCTAVALSRLLAPGATFVDVGANVGLFSLLASRWVGPHGRVVSLEPSSREFARLRRHVELNRLTNVLTLQVAAGDERGHALLHVAEGRYPGLNTLASSFMYAGIAEDRTEEVAVMPLDDLLPAQGIETVSVIKIDVEGLEPQVVQGARETIRRIRPAVVLEIAGAALDPAHEGRRSIERLLTGAGYQFAAVEGETASIRRTSDLAQPAENLIAAPPATLARLLTES